MGVLCSVDGCSQEASKVCGSFIKIMHNDLYLCGGRRMCWVGLLSNLTSSRETTSKIVRIIAWQLSTPTFLKSLLGFPLVM